jgi:hypothetical protein
VGALALTLLLAQPTGRADTPEPLSPQTMQVPSGPASLKGLGESFSPNPATGMGAFGIPIDLPPGLLTPEVKLSYNGGFGKSRVGSGWQLSRFRIYRATDKGLPGFNEKDRFSVQGPGTNDELVLVDPVERLYRLKNEGGFALFVRNPFSDFWNIHLKGVKPLFCARMLVAAKATAMAPIAVG